MIKKAILPAVAGFLLLVAIFVYWPKGKSQPDPDALARQAREAATSQERQLALADLASVGIQALAKNERDDARWQKVAGYLREFAGQANDPVMKSLAIQGLGECFDFDSMDLIFAAMNDENSLVRARAGVAADRLIGASFGYNPEAPAAQRQKAIQAYQTEWTRIKSKAFFEDFKRQARGEPIQGTY